MVPTHGEANEHVQRGWIWRWIQLKPAHMLQSMQWNGDLSCRAEGGGLICKRSVDGGGLRWARALLGSPSSPNQERKPIERSGFRSTMPDDRGKGGHNLRASNGLVAVSSEFGVFLGVGGGGFKIERVSFHVCFSPTIPFMVLCHMRNSVTYPIFEAYARLY